MAPHSSVLAWRIPGTVEPGRQGVEAEGGSISDWNLDIAQTNLS